MRVIGLPRAVADPHHVTGRAVPVAGGGVDARHRLLVAEQQRLMADVEIGGAQLRMAIGIEPASPHEIQRLRDAVGQFLIVLRARRVLDEAEHPFMHAREAGVAAMRERAQEIDGGGGLPVGFDLPARVRRARLLGEGEVVDDVAAVARQLAAVDRLGRRGTRLGELAGDPPDLHDRRGGRVREHHRHLQQHAKEVADVVGMVLGETLGAVAALQQETLARRYPAQRPLEVARLPGEHQRREGRDQRLDLVQCLPVRILRGLHDRLCAPAVGRPTLGHDSIPYTRAAAYCTAAARLIHDTRRGMPPCHLSRRRPAANVARQIP